MIKATCTPCRASRIEDVKVRLELLKQVKGIFLIGFEVVGPYSNFFQEANREKIIENLGKARESGLEMVTIHSPFSWHTGKDNLTNLSKSENLERLQTIFDLAKEVKAVNVNFHADLLYTFSEMQEISDEERERVKKLVAGNIQELNRGPVTLELENMAYPWGGDIFYSPSKMVYDPFFADPLELYDFAQEADISITFDTCHWATLCIPMPLLAIFQKIEKRVNKVHLSDVLGRWLPGTAIFREGVVPGEGNLGEENFQQLVSYLRDNVYSIILTMETKDKDFKNPEESRESFKRVFNWLS